MEIRYHVQRQALEFAEQILAVPADYPLNPALPEDFRQSFSRLCELAKRIYLDMAENPEAYGLILVPIDETDNKAVRGGYRTLNRFVDTLNALFKSGEVRDHCLNVDAAKFRVAIRSLPPVSKYGLVLSKLCALGFSVSSFNGTAIDKKAEAFTVEFPDDPQIIDTLKIYFDRWSEIDRFRNNRDQKPIEWIKISPQEFQHHFYCFDYKITADLPRLSISTWLNDEADFYGYGSELKKFQTAFYDEMQKYKGIEFDGDYNYKGKRIARITLNGFPAMEEKNFVLSLKLKEPDKYAEYLESLPQEIKAPMSVSSCSYCGFQGSTKEHCKFRLHWTLEGKKHTGCAFVCFTYHYFAPEAAPIYAKLLELEYGLKKA